MAQRLSNLPLGSKIKDNGTMYKGNVIVWQIVDKQNASYPANTVTLQTEKLITDKCFDAAEPANTNSQRAVYGNNRYRFSNIRQWLGSDKPSVAWFTKQHNVDTPPELKGLLWPYSTGDDYINEPGFLCNFSSQMKNALIDTTLTTTLTILDGGGTEQVTDKIFLPSFTEVGRTTLGGPYAQGTPYSYYVTNPNEIFATTIDGRKGYYWLRSPTSQDSTYMAGIVSDGSISTWNQVNSTSGYIRPVCNIHMDTYVSDTSNSDGIYTLVWNRPPTIPNSISVPDTVQGGRTISISWTNSIDEDGNLAGYILERSVNNQPYQTLFQGSNLSFVDSIIFGWISVAYRVKAYDTNGETSGYATSDTRIILNNTPPVISGNDENLGLKMQAFTFPYSVNDIDQNQTVQVDERIDGSFKKNFICTLGKQYDFEITQNNWIELTNGLHQLTITASDNFGGTTVRTIGFEKNETEIEFMLSTPLPSDDMIRKSVMKITSQIPQGADFEITVCNNANDVNPTWENITSCILNNEVFTFTNSIKTAENWGYNLKVKVQRLTGIGECHIKAIEGSFE